jgi:hypothetical protein
MSTEPQDGAPLATWESEGGSVPVSYRSAASLRKSAQLGELVVAVFDIAGTYSTDPREVSRLATFVVRHLLGSYVDAPPAVGRLAPAVSSPLLTY